MGVGGWIGIACLLCVPRAIQRLSHDESGGATVTSPPSCNRSRPGGSTARYPKDTREDADAACIRVLSRSVRVLRSVVPVWMRTITERHRRPIRIHALFRT